MKAAVFYQKGDLRIEEIAMPEIGADEVLIRVRAEFAVRICTSLTATRESRLRGSQQALQSMRLLPRRCGAFL